MKAKGKSQTVATDGKSKRSALFLFSYKTAQPSKSHFCPLPFAFCLLCVAFCLLLSPGRAQDRINLNTAPAEELTRLPFVGNTVAQRILEHRRKHGPFKRPQDLIVIKGLSAKRYRQIAHLIRI
jgi:competence ComEA-like helix-hairpin-helix protein